ncbi:hypothetical protein [Burkholderia gladioli]|uniref:Uncharacterized protein n=1 Tax=Burkholderia gladioli TaxID=28095 RepID=A0AAW3FC88_BURGA|nr:hypothetical protein [Burkholderia gladioli]AJW93860.1 hypothetical protein BM43_7527 [Burkholderia gladioli]KGC20353.1 hypothetical protein DM48_7951 [Burkholderia gladioli]MBJ9711255.1 hypothetical protein [Burkholderia gladioli]MCH7273553.1 hypothetical protein [Burkholderia gladioli]MDN7499531.1 hypothetical protein [Burkholderia gladioli]
MTALDYSVSTAAAQWLTVVRTLRRHVLGDGAALRGSPRCGGDADASATTASGAGLSTASDPIVEPNRTAADPFGSLGGIVSSTPQAVGFQHEADGAQSGPGIGQTRPHSPRPGCLATWQWADSTRAGLGRGVPASAP